MREEWLVYRSEEGARELLRQTVGENALTIRGTRGTLAVPFSDKGAWIGREGCVVGFLKAMLHLRELKIV